MDDEGELSEPPPAPVEPALLSPSDGVRLDRSPWIPLSARLPDRAAGAVVSVTLDGRPWSDPQAVLRRRIARRGGGLDYLATLDLLPLQAGQHTLELRAELPGQAPVVLRSRFTYAPPPHRVELEVVDGRGQPVSARVAVFDEGGRHLLASPDADRVDPNHRDTVLSSLFATDGRAALRVGPGRYRFVAVRSLRDGLGVGELEVKGDQRLRLVVPELVPTPGELTADLHVHSAESADAFTPHAMRFAALACAGLDVVVLTDHNRVVDPRPHLAAVEPASPLAGLAGVEVPVRGTEPTSGHLNAFPVAASSPAPGGLGLAATLDAWRALAQEHPWPDAQGRLILQLNHPRGIGFRPEDPPRKDAHALFTSLGFDRRVPPGEGPNAWMSAAEPTGTTALEIDAMEIVNRFSWKLYRAVRRDWFALLDAGVPVTGTGNSDSHALALELAGSPVNLVRVGEDRSTAAFLDAIDRGRLSVSTGPILSLEVRDARGGRAEPGDRLEGSGPLTVIARVRAAPWVPVPELRLIKDGRLLARQPLPRPPEGEPLDFSAVFTAVAERDGWLLLEAGWPLDDEDPRPGGLFRQVYPNAVPLAFTNPVRLDADADGVWRPGD